MDRDVNQKRICGPILNDRMLIISRSVFAYNKFVKYLPLALEREFIILFSLIMVPNAKLKGRM